MNRTPDNNKQSTYTTNHNINQGVEVNSDLFNTPILLDKHDLETSVMESIVLMPFEESELVIKRYNEDQAFKDALNAAVSDTAVRITAAEILDDVQWALFHEKIRNMAFQPSFYDDPSIKSVLSVIFMEQLAEADMTYIKERLILLAKILTIDPIN